MPVIKANYSVRIGVIAQLMVFLALLPSTFASSTTYEAEDATVYGASIEGTYVDFVNANNDYIEWTVSTSNAGVFDLDFEYALGYGSRPLELTVNGNVEVGSLDFPSTGSWSNYDTISSSSNLNSGNNTVKIKAIGSSGGNYDKLVVTEQEEVSEPEPTWTGLPDLEQGQVTVSANWIQVDYEISYTTPVVFCTPIYTSSDKPVVPRVKLSSTYFEVRLTNADGTTNSITPRTVNYIVINEGYYTEEENGVNMEIATFDSDFVDYKTSWTGNTLNLTHEYTDPAVFGQIVTGADAGNDYQSFWSEIQTNGSVVAGRHVGEDSTTTRSDETYAYMVIEQGDYLMGNVIVSVGETGIDVEGIPATATDITTNLLSYENAVAMVNSLEGSDGVFPVITSMSNVELKVAVDEDQIGDAERTHTAENVSYFAMSREVPAPTFSPTGNTIVFSSQGGLVSISSEYPGTIHFTTNYNTPTIYSDVYTSSVNIQDDTTIKAIVAVDGFDPSAVASVDVDVTELIGNTGNGYLLTWYNWPYGGDQTYTFDTVPQFQSAQGKEIKTNNLGEIVMNKFKTVRMDAYLNITSADNYTFYLGKTNNAASKFYINDMNTPRINMGVTTTYSDNFTLYLDTGYHEIRIDAINSIFSGNTSLEYASSNISRSAISGNSLFYSVDQYVDDNIDTDGDGIMNADESTYGTSVTLADTDGDGLSDYDEEIVYGTDGTKKDTDGDGYDDFMEAIVFHSLDDDYLGNLTNIQSINPINYSTFKGSWSGNGTDLYSNFFRGEVEYAINLTTDTMPLLEIGGRANGENPYPAIFDIAVWVDDVYVGRKPIISAADYQEEDYGMTFNGSVTIDEDADYTFYTESDDGSQLYINGSLVVDNDGTHAMTEQSGNIELNQGLHNIEVLFFHKNGDEGLKVTYSSANIQQKYIPSTKLSELDWEYYEGVWSTLPDYDTLTPLKIGKTDTFNINARRGVNSGNALFLLPWLSSGNHNVNVLWDNDNYISTLRLEDINVYSIGGNDNDANGVKDWIDQKLEAECTVEVPTETKISPVCLEGKARYIDLMGIIPGATINKANGLRWYCNIDLNETLDTDITVSFQDDLYNLEETITWETTDIFDVTGKIYVREGDSLLLNPYDLNEGSATLDIYDGTSSSNIDVITYAGYAYEFQNAGQYEITATFTDASSNVQIKTIQVDAIDLSLPTNTLQGLVNHERKVNLPVVHAAQYDFDPRLKAFYETGIVSGTGPEREFAISLDEREERTIVARLKDDGPIIGHINLQGLEVSGAGKTWIVDKQPLSDGTSVVSMGLVAYPLQEDTEINVEIYLSGVLFPDGETTQVVEPDDFNEINEEEIIFYKSTGGSDTSSCHHLEVYQNGDYAGRAY